MVIVTNCLAVPMANGLAITDRYLCWNIPALASPLIILVLPGSGSLDQGCDIVVGSKTMWTCKASRTSRRQPLFDVAIAEQEPLWPQDGDRKFYQANCRLSRARAD